MAGNNDILLKTVGSADAAIVALQGAVAPGIIPPTRTITTTAPLAGGGDLSADRTISIPAATGASDGYATAAQITAIGTAQSTATAAAGAAAAAQVTASAAIPKSLATAADQGLYSTAIDAWAASALTSFGRSLWAAVDATAFKLLVTYSKGDVGLGSVDNTSDANKPVSTAQATADGLRVLKSGDTMTGPLAISSAWAAATGLLSLSGADALGYLPVLVRNSSINVNSQAGMDFGFDNSHRVTFAVARSGQSAPFTSSAYFYSIGQTNGLRFLTGDASDISFWANSGLRGTFKSAGPFEVGAKTSSTNSNEAKQVIYGATVNSTTPEVMLRMVRSEAAGVYYPSAVDFLCYSFGAGGAPNYYANSVLKIRMKNLGTFSETTTVDVLELRADGSVYIPALNTADCLLKTSGTGGLVAIDTGLTFAAARLTTPKLTVGGDVALSKTITTPGTTGAQTVNKATGRVNFAIGATSLVVTNSLVTANSIIHAVAATNDATGRVTSVVAGAGSFTIYAIAPTAEMAVNFLVTN